MVSKPPKNYQENLEKRCAEESRIIQTLRRDLEQSHGLADHPKAGLLWSLAWDYGHAYGASEIRSYYGDLVELVK